MQKQDSERPSSAAEGTKSPDKYAAEKMWETTLQIVRENGEISADELKKYFGGNRKYKGLPPEIVTEVINERIDGMERNENEYLFDLTVKAVDLLEHAGLATR